MSITITASSVDSLCGIITNLSQKETEIVMRLVGHYVNLHGSDCPHHIEMTVYGAVNIYFYDDSCEHEIWQEITATLFD